jgi:hypothetical protein
MAVAIAAARHAIPLVVLLFLVSASLFPADASGLFLFSL